MFTYIHNTHSTEKVALIAFPLGSIHDPIGKEGLAHVFEHVVLEIFVKKYSFELEKKGININAETNKNFVAFFVHSHTATATDLAHAINNLFGVIESELYIGDQFKSILIEMSTRAENHQEHFWNVFEKKHLHGTGYAHQSIGTKVSLKNISISDVQKYADEVSHLAPLSVIVSNEKISLSEQDVLEKICINKKADTNALLPRGRVVLPHISPGPHVQHNNDYSELSAIFFLQDNVQKYQDAFSFLLAEVFSKSWSLPFFRIMRLEDNCIYDIDTELFFAADFTSLQVSIHGAEGTQSLLTEKIRSSLQEIIQTPEYFEVLVSMCRESLCHFASDSVNLSLFVLVKMIATSEPHQFQNLFKDITVITHDDFVKFITQNFVEVC